MNNEGHGNDLQKIIAQGFDELKHIHGESFDPQKGESCGTRTDHRSKPQPSSYS